MAQANINLPNGTKITIEGTPEEITKVLSLYATANSSLPSERTRPITTNQSQSPGRQTAAALNPKPETQEAGLADIINQIKGCEWAEKIESEILDKSAQVNRILLPLFIAHEYFKNEIPLTSGDISRITSNLGIPIHIANVSNTLAGTASKYVISNGIRKKGNPVQYKLNRRGVQYFKSLLEDQTK